MTILIDAVIFITIGYLIAKIGENMKIHVKSKPSTKHIVVRYK